MAEEKSEEGLPVTSDLVKRKCSGCHHADDKGRLTRISYRRTTPEGWEQTLKRMVTLNNLKIEPAEAREIVRYLADHHGLAPEEAKPAAFEVERRQIDYQFADKNADKDKKLTEETCIACHSMGRVISQRRTKERMGAARRDASRLLLAVRFSGLSSYGPVAPRARRRGAAA